MMIPIEEIRFTLCFLTCKDQVLMLKRKNPPNQGLWNGVGGHIEAHEDPLQSCLREVAEETGYHPKTLNFGGILTWTGFEIKPGGLYIFSTEVEEQFQPDCDEGLLAWKPREWVFSSPEVVGNIHRFAPIVLGDTEPHAFHFDYQDGEIVRYFQRPLSTPPP